MHQPSARRDCTLRHPFLVPGVRYVPIQFIINYTRWTNDRIKIFSKIVFRIKRVFKVSKSISENALPKWMFKIMYNISQFYRNEYSKLCTSASQVCSYFHSTKVSSLATYITYVNPLSLTNDDSEEQWRTYIHTYITNELRMKDIFYLFMEHAPWDEYDVLFPSVCAFSLEQYGIFSFAVIGDNIVVFKLAWRNVGRMERCVYWN